MFCLCTECKMLLLFDCEEEQAIPMGFIYEKKSIKGQANKILEKMFLMQSEIINIVVSHFCQEYLN